MQRLLLKSVVTNIISLMNNKSFFHQIIWIPNYVVKPKGISQWFAMFYNIFLVIAIYRLSSAADNFIQFLAFPKSTDSIIIQINGQAALDNALELMTR